MKHVKLVSTERPTAAMMGLGMKGMMGQWMNSGSGMWNTMAQVMGRYKGVSAS